MAVERSFSTHWYPIEARPPTRCSSQSRYLRSKNDPLRPRLQGEASWAAVRYADRVRAAALSRQAAGRTSGPGRKPARVAAAGHMVAPARKLAWGVVRQAARTLAAGQKWGRFAAAIAAR